jgi:hypothetical protein
MIHPNEIIVAGQQAWLRVKQARPQFDDWVAIGKCLAVGKACALKEAGTNRPYGPVYMKSMASWLATHGMNDIDVQERRGAIFLAENETEITRWRNSLSAAEARHCNHPSTIKKHYEAGTRPQPRGPKKGHVVYKAATAARYDPAHRPSQDMIRRCALAMKISGRQDYFSLATICIEALTREDLRALLGEKERADAPSFEVSHGLDVYA